jgi:hypothetical protein
MKMKIDGLSGAGKARKTPPYQTKSLIHYGIGGE